VRSTVLLRVGLCVRLVKYYETRSKFNKHFVVIEKRWLIGAYQYVRMTNSVRCVCPTSTIAKSDAVACLPAILPVPVRHLVVFVLRFLFSRVTLCTSHSCEPRSRLAEPALRTASSDFSNPTGDPNTAPQKLHATAVMKKIWSMVSPGRWRSWRLSLSIQ
jgi:hypothetical protein